MTIEQFGERPHKNRQANWAKKKLIHLMLVSDRLVFPKHLQKEIQEIVDELWEKNKKVPLAKIIFK